MVVHSGSQIFLIFCSVWYYALCGIDHEPQSCQSGSWFMVLLFKDD